MGLSIVELSNPANFRQKSSLTRLLDDLIAFKCCVKVSKTSDLMLNLKKINFVEKDKPITGVLKENRGFSSSQQNPFLSPVPKVIISS